MQPKSWQEVTTQILALNHPDSPALYALAGASIVGSWNLTGQAPGLATAKDLDRAYEVRFVLDEASHSYTYSEYFGSNQNVGIDPQDGAISTEGMKSFFSGKSWRMHRTKKSTTTNGQANASTIQTDFTPDLIKSPIMTVLTNVGWHEQKMGVLTRIFGR